MHLEEADRAYAVAEEIARSTYDQRMAEEKERRLAISAEYSAHALAPIQSKAAGSFRPAKAPRTAGAKSKASDIVEE